MGVARKSCIQLWIGYSENEARLEVFVHPTKLKPFFVRFDPLTLQFHTCKKSRISLNMNSKQKDEKQLFMWPKGLVNPLPGYYLCGQVSQWLLSLLLGSIPLPSYLVFAPILLKTRVLDKHIHPAHSFYDIMLQMTMH